MSNPPVTKILDYGQYKYEQARKEKEARKHQRSVEFKEVRLRVKIGKGDFDTKVKRAIRFLEDGDRVKVAVQFRGREVSHAYIGRDLLNRFAEQVADYGTVDRQPVLEGRSMSMVLTSTQKPGSHARPRPRPQRRTTEEQASGAGRSRHRRSPRTSQRPPRRPAQEADASAQDEEPQGSPEALRRHRQWQGLPSQVLARSPPRDQVVAAQASLRGQGHRLTAPTRTPSSGCCRTCRSTTSQWHESSAASPPTSVTSVCSRPLRARPARTAG